MANFTHTKKWTHRFHRDKFQLDQLTNLADNINTRAHARKNIKNDEVEEKHPSTDNRKEMNIAHSFHRYTAIIIILIYLRITPAQSSSTESCV